MKTSLIASLASLLVAWTFVPAAELNLVPEELPAARVPNGPILESPQLPRDEPFSILQTTPAHEVQQPLTYPVAEPSRRLVSMKDVDYRYHRGGAKGRFCRDEMKEICVVVKDPCQKCCELEIPVCVPCCCEAPCSTKCSKGIFGREITEYCWDCGFRLEVVATKHGDFIVHHYGVK